MNYIKVGDDFRGVSDSYATLLAETQNGGGTITLYPETDPLVIAYLTVVAESLKPKEVTMRQARLALLEAGLLSTVEAAISGMTGAAGEAARIEWEYSSALKREQPLVAALAATLGLTSVDLDTLFLSASTK